MTIGADSTASERHLRRDDWWSRRFGNRGLLQLIVGEDVEAILAITALGTLAYLIVVKGNYEVLGSFVNLLIFVVVFSFFARLTRVLIRTIQTAQAGRNPR